MNMELPDNNKEGFKVPEGYFEDFTRGLMDELSHSKPNGHGAGFKVPENYFGTVGKNISESVADIAAKEVRPLSYRKYYIAAASIAVLLALALVRPWAPNLAESALANLDDADIEAYLQENNVLLSFYELSELAPADPWPIGDILQEPLDPENLMDYLDNAIEDYNELNIP